MQTLTEDIQEVLEYSSLPSSPLLTLSPPQFAPLMDKRVEIHGTTRHDMNGQRGIATDFVDNDSEARDRYTVHLDDGSVYNIKPANVRAERAGAGGGARTKGKGKGKGRGKGGTK